MKVLLINSDLAKNRGDRAIAEGIIQLIRERFPSAKITGLSEQASRDETWFGIDFLKQDSQSLKLLDFIELLKAARNADLILWGGGEILKDYTNKLALWYWACKISALRLVNPRLYGVYQGVGPTTSRLSRLIVAFVVRRCRMFIVRDQESADKLVSWGVPSSKLIASSDPAVLPEPEALGSGTFDKLATDNGIDESFLENFICIGPRKWFHYKTGGLIPFKYRDSLARFFRSGSAREDRTFALYLQHMTKGIDAILDVGPHNILLVPMHMVEDPDLCRHLAAHASQPARVKVLERDDYSPRELRAIMARARAMVGFRLHSAIIATSCAVPSLNYYYVDKGRVYFDQIGQSHNAVPVSHVLEGNFSSDAASRISNLLDRREAIRAEIRSHVAILRQSVRTAFARALS